MGSIPKFDDKHTFFSLSRNVQELAAPLAKLEVNYFAFKRTFNDGSKIYLFTNPTYYQHYFSEEYFMIGNKEGASVSYSSSYDLWDYLPDPQGLYTEASREFDISHGLTITRKNKDFCDFFFFATTQNQPLVKKLYLNNREIFEHFCDYFLDIGKEIILTATSAKVFLPYEPKIKLPEEDPRIDQFIKEISKKHPLHQIKLTNRERQCAYYLKQGKANKIIAQKLKLSVRTVEEHIFNIRIKTQCKNKPELVTFLAKWPDSVFSIK